MIAASAIRQRWTGGRAGEKGTGEKGTGKRGQEKGNRKRAHAAFWLTGGNAWRHNPPACPERVPTPLGRVERVPRRNESRFKFKACPERSRRIQSLPAVAFGGGGSKVSVPFSVLRFIIPCSSFVFSSPNLSSAAGVHPPGAGDLCVETTPRHPGTTRGKSGQNRPCLGQIEVFPGQIGAFQGET